MPIVAIIVGIIMGDLAFRGTEHQFAQQLGKDFGSGGNFLSWLAAIVIIGAMGYVKTLRPISTPLLALVIVVLVLRNGGLFQNLAQVIENPPKAAPAVSLSSYKNPSSSSSSSGGGGGGGSSQSSSGGGFAQYAELIAAFA